MHKLYLATHIIIYCIIFNVVFGLRILCIGDSITQGRVLQYSYRRPLQLMLRNASIRFDFVGSQYRPWGGQPFTYLTSNWDLSHEGYSGKTSTQLLELVRIPNPSPDIALLHVGTNDNGRAYNNADDFRRPITNNTNKITISKVIRSINNHILRLQRVNPNVIIFVAQIIPSSPNARNNNGSRIINGKLVTFWGIRELNTEIGNMVRRLNNPRVIVVDHYTGWIQSVDMISDGIHPSAAGEIKMARNWFNAITRIIR
jgi:lysophospholipase L1-like esterase